MTNLTEGIKNLGYQDFSEFIKKSSDSTSKKKLNESKKINESLTKDEILNVLSTIKAGKNIGIIYRTQLGAGKISLTYFKNNPLENIDSIHIEKEGHVVLTKNNHLDTTQPPIGWGEWVRDANGDIIPCVIKHNGNYYVAFTMNDSMRNGISAPKYTYFLNGNQVQKEDIQKYLRPSAYSSLEEPHSDYRINFDHIKRIKYAGQVNEEYSIYCSDDDFDSTIEEDVDIYCSDDD